MSAVLDQWDNDEIMEEIDIEKEGYGPEELSERQEESNHCSCSRGCFDCLGMSWRDFF